MKLLKIALSNIKKRKSSAITIFAIVAMASLMLSISLSLLLNIGNFYDRKRTELNAPDLSMYIIEADWQDEMLEYTNNYAGVTKSERIELFIAETRYTFGTEKINLQFIIHDDSAPHLFNTFNVIDGLSVKPQDSIILPLSFKYNGFKSGEKFTFQCVGTEFNFTIYGFCEDTELGAATNSVKKTYVNPTFFASLDNTLGFQKGSGVFVSFLELDTSYNFQTDFMNRYSFASSISIGTYEGAKTAAITFPLIMSLVLILIAVIVISIALIIVRFSIMNNIEEDIKTLGALKSIGFTSRQLVTSILLQFLLISFFGSIAGVLIGLLTMGYVGNVLSATSGLLWSGTSFFVPALIALVLLIGITAAVTYLVAKKSKTITPINALREGLSNHTFKKNYVPLEKTKLPVNLAIAAKNFILAIKNNITVFVVLVLFSFSTVLGFALYHNFVLDTAAFKQMMGAEPANIILASQNEQLIDEICSRDEIVKALKNESFSATIDNKMINIYVWEHLEQREAKNVIRGRDPISVNEIAITSDMVKILGKDVGDVINIEYEGATASYLITGVVQGIGQVYSNMTLEGFQRLKSDVSFGTAYLFLANSDIDYVDNFINTLKLEYGNDIDAINYVEAINSTLSSLKDPIAIATYLITAIIIFTACFVFFLVVNTIIRRRKKDFGIMKALGFTSRQIIAQMLLSFLPVIIAAVGIGTIIGVFITNPILGVMFGGLGIAKPLFVISAPLTAITELSLMAVCILTVYLVSLKTKNISPQKLIVEQ